MSLVLSGAVTVDGSSGGGTGQPMAAASPGQLPSKPVWVSRPVKVRLDRFKRNPERLAPALQKYSEAMEKWEEWKVSHDADMRVWEAAAHACRSRNYRLRHKEDASGREHSASASSTAIVVVPPSAAEARAELAEEELCRMLAECIISACAPPVQPHLLQLQSPRQTECAALRCARQCTFIPMGAAEAPPIFILSLNRSGQFHLLMSSVLAGYAGRVYGVLNNIYEADGTVKVRFSHMSHHLCRASLTDCFSTAPQVQAAQPYIELLREFTNMELWLLPPLPGIHGGLAEARSDLLRRLAGKGMCVVMDDDAKSFLLSVVCRTNVKGIEGKPISFSAVVKRLVSAMVSIPEAKVVGINHWYHHACTEDSTKAVTSGRQHIAFQPLLVRLPAPLPASLATQWSYIEDDEFIWRLTAEYGEDAAVKLRYVIGKFDVGFMDGGLQSEGVPAAKAAQAREVDYILQHHADVFREGGRRRSGRQAGKHARMIVDPAKLKGVTIGGRRAGKVIEKLVRP